MLYLVDSVDETKMYWSSDKGETWSGDVTGGQLDIDPSDTSGDTKSRDMDIQCAWHDRSNEVIYFGDCDQNTNDYDVWKLDYSVSETAPTIIEITTVATGDAGTVSLYDIFLLADGNVYAINYEKQAGASKLVVNDVDTNPAVEKVTLAVGLAEWTLFGVVNSNDYYAFEESGGALYCITYKGNGVDTLTRSVDTINPYNHETNISQNGMTYDSTNNILYAVMLDAGAEKLISYDITGDDFTVIDDFDIAMMCDRNTASSSVFEKAFHITSYEVYQIHSKFPYQWHHISTPITGEVIIGITDNFLITTTGKMFEYTDVSEYVRSCRIHRQDMQIPRATFNLHNTYTLAEGMFVIIEDTFTTAGSTSTEIIFEGFVDSFIEGQARQARLLSPAIELLNIRPSGEYSGRSDQIISSLISDYCSYITAGTMSNGGAMGSIDFYGDKTMLQILNDLALFDNFIWYLTPEGELYYNNGTVDTTENFTEASHIVRVDYIKGKRAINYVLIKGAYVSGTQVKSDGSHIDDTNMRRFGKNPYERTHSHLDTAALCNTTATNILSRFGTQAKIIEFRNTPGSIGLMQEGETITFEYAGPDITISSAQYGIREVTYDARLQKAYYRISDRIL
jgi:hypothetical protein